MLIRDATVLDVPGRKFDEWVRAFTTDAVFVNCNGPGSELGKDDMARFLAKDDPVHSHQHLLSNIVVVSLDGDHPVRVSACRGSPDRLGTEGEVHSQGDSMMTNSSPHPRAGGLHTTRSPGAGTATRW